LKKKTLRIILEQDKEWQSDVKIGFIDFTNAFDTVNRSQMWRILKLYGIPANMIRIIKLILQRLQNDGRPRRKVQRPDKHRKRSKTRLRLVTHAVPYYDSRLNNQKANRQHNRNNMEIAEQTGRYRVSRRCVFTN
jgi:hypothetical protein